MGDLITREEWGAIPPKHVDPLLWTSIDAIAIHYTAAYTDEFPKYADRVKAIQNYHMLTNGWSDIAYNWLVARDGSKFIGRGEQVQSAATLGHNDHTQAICFLGSDVVSRDDVTDDGRRAISELLFMCEQRSGKNIGNVNVIHGTVKTLAVSGHRVFTSTECPGNELFAFVATKGWDAYRGAKPGTYPKYFFNWAAWYLGEGPYKAVGPKNKKFRPQYPKAPVAPIYWLALRRFLNARKAHQD